METIIIGISGNYRSGKNTFGDMLEEILTHMDILVKQFAFADPLKNMAKKYFKWDGNKCSDYERWPEPGEADPHTLVGGRSLLQGVGEMMRTEIDDDFWIDRCIGDIKDWAEALETPTTCVAIITDVRYLNEAEILTSPAETMFPGAKLFYMQRPGYEGDEHPSEAELRTDEFRSLVTAFIDNNSSLEALKEKAIEAASKIARRCLKDG